MSALTGATVGGGAILAWTGTSWWPALAASGGGVIGNFAPAWADAWSERVEGRRRARELSPPTSRASLAGLLGAEQRIVPFIGRQAEIGALLEWCSDPQAAPVCLFVGSGGVGKSRLAMQLADQLAETGWWWTAVQSEAEADAWNVAHAATKRPVLLVVDYAETRFNLPSLLRSVVRAEDSSRIRVLLLARSTGEWWERLASDDPAIRALVGNAKLLSLSADLDSGLDPRALVEQAIPHFALALGIDPPHQLSVDLPMTPVPVLVLHAAALVAVLRHAEQAGLRAADSQLPHASLITEADVFDELLKHETRLWRTSRPSVLPDLSTAAYRALVALVCLYSPADLAAAAEALVRVPELSDANQVVRRETARWLQQLFPPAPGADRWWASLIPDLVAEHLVCEALTDTPELINAYLRGLDTDAAAAALTVLARATVHHPRAAQLIDQSLRIHFDVLIDAALRVAVQTGGEIGIVLARVLADVALPQFELIRIQREIPFPTTNLAAAALVIVQLIVAGMSAEAEPAERARWMNTLGISLREAGRLEEALAATVEAADFYRTLAEANPGQYLAELATVLAELGIRLSEVGRPAEALPQTAEAVRLNRALAAAETGSRRGELAGSLTDLGVRYMELGQWAEAREPAQEAIDLFRELAVDDPEHHLDALGRSVSNLGVIYQGLGQPIQALPLEEESVAIWRELVAISPDRYLPDLAWSLSALGIRHSQLGHWAEALAAQREGVDIERRLIMANHDLHINSLARSLTHLGIRFADLDQRADALAATEEAVAIRRNLVKEHPGRYLDDLAFSLDALGERLAQADHLEQALAATAEAVVLRRDVARDNPGRHRSTLALALCRLGARYVDLDRPRDALAPALDAVRMYRQLVGVNPAPSLSGLADSLSSLAVALAALGHPVWALELAQEASDIYRRLVQLNAAPHQRGLHKTLVILAERLTERGRVADADQVRAELSSP
jgi:tetratricopeptide (TPR) repeat protein